MSREFGSDNKVGGNLDLEKLSQQQECCRLEKINYL